MTPLQFESAYQPVWDELDEALAQVEGKPRRKKDDKGRRRMDKSSQRPAARMAALYRTTCEHLALARSRDYPVHITARLEALTERGHQAIYRSSGNSLARLGQLVLLDMPQAVRSHRLYMWTALAVFGLPLVIVALLCYFDPGFVLSVQDINTVREYDAMYGPSSSPVGRTRGAGDDWSAFGFYIMNNIGIAFKCFAGGVFFGLGSLFFLAFNGAFMGAVAGYLTYKGYTETFYSFVITHGAFELTAIVISGAAGLAIGHALVAPRRLTRAQALKKASADAVPLMYLAIAMLLIAAAIEAFWSSSRWVTPLVKYSVGGLCWTMVLAYLGWQGRTRTPEAAHAG